MRTRAGSTTAHCAVGRHDAAGGHGGPEGNARRMADRPKARRHNPAASLIIIKTGLLQAACDQSRLWPSIVGALSGNAAKLVLGQFPTYFLKLYFNAPSVCMGFYILPFNMTCWAHKPENVRGWKDYSALNSII